MVSAADRSTLVTLASLEKALTIVENNLDTLHSAEAERNERPVRVDRQACDDGCHFR